MLFESEQNRDRLDKMLAAITSGAIGYL